MSRAHILRRGGMVSGCLILASCGASPNEGPSRPTLPVETVAVSEGAHESGSIAQSAPVGASYAAVIAYDRESTLSARVGGIARSVPITIGVRLSRGSLVVALDDMPYLAALARATADHDKLARAQERNMTLLAAGAIGSADAQDNQSVLQAARAAQVSARYDLSSTRVRMPFEGVVLSKAVDVGATVAPGQPLATVADMGSSLIARAQVPAEVANRLQRGMAATVTMSGAAAAITGHILRKGALSDTRTGTVEIDVALPAPHALVSGTVASVQFGEGAIRNATIPGSPAVQYIPAEALVDSHDGHGHVFIVDPRDKSAHLVAITVYGFDDDSLRISGLHDDARVITVGAGYVADGQKVTVLAR